MNFLAKRLELEVSYGLEGIKCIIGLFPMSLAIAIATDINWPIVVELAKRKNVAGWAGSIQLLW